MKSSELELKRNTLIYFYENGIKTNEQILRELLQKSNKVSAETINNYIKDNNINVNDYYCIFDTDYPREFYKWEDAPYIIKKVVYENTTLN